MSFKKWLAIILIVIFVGIPVFYLIMFRLNPGIAAGMETSIFGPLFTTLVGFKENIEANPFWIQNDIWISGAFFGVICTLSTALLVYKGRDALDSIRGVARVRATDSNKFTPSMQREPAEPEPQSTPTPKVVEAEPQQEKKTE